MNIQDETRVFHGKAIKAGTREFLDGQLKKSTHFVSLHPNAPVPTSDVGGKMLKKWHDRINKALTGKSWRSNPELCCEWVAVSEKDGEHRHWHLAFRLPEAISEQRLLKVYGKDRYSCVCLKGERLKGLAALAHVEWRGVAPSGTAAAGLINGTATLAAYMSKEASRPHFWDRVNFSPT